MPVELHLCGTQVTWRSLHFPALHVEASGRMSFTARGNAVLLRRRIVYSCTGLHQHIFHSCAEPRAYPQLPLQQSCFASSIPTTTTTTTTVMFCLEHTHNYHCHYNSHVFWPNLTRVARLVKRACCPARHTPVGTAPHIIRRRALLHAQIVELARMRSALRHRHAPLPLGTRGVLARVPCFCKAAGGAIRHAQARGAPICCLCLYYIYIYIYIYYYLYRILCIHDIYVIYHYHYFDYYYTLYMSCVCVCVCTQWKAACPRRV